MKQKKRNIKQNVKMLKIFPNIPTEKAMSQQSEWDIKATE